MTQSGTVQCRSVGNWNRNAPSKITSPHVYIWADCGTCMCPVVLSRNFKAKKRLLAFMKYRHCVENAINITMGTITCILHAWKTTKLFCVLTFCKLHYFLYFQKNKSLIQYSFNQKKMYMYIRNGYLREDRIIDWFICPSI